MKSITVLGLAVLTLAGPVQGIGGEVRKLGEDSPMGKRMKERAAERQSMLEQEREAAETRQAEIERKRAEWKERREELEQKKADWELRKAEFEKRRAEVEAKKAEGEQKREALEARKAELKEQRENEREQRHPKGAAWQERAGEYVDRRQECQDKRIQHGIRKGYLTPEETAVLRARQKAIAELEEALKGDGHLTRSEFAQLREALNDASRMIWAEKHDTEGRQMPVYRLGHTVFALDSLTSQLANEHLTRAEARRLLGDFRRLLKLQDRLANEDLSEDARQKLQEEYEKLLAVYFRAE